MSQDEDSQQFENVRDEFFDAFTIKGYVSRDGATSQLAGSSHVGGRVNNSRSEAASSVMGGSHLARDNAPPSTSVPLLTCPQKVILQQEF